MAEDLEFSKIEMLPKKNKSAISKTSLRLTRGSSKFNLQTGVSKFVGRFFFTYGKFVGLHPFIAIFVCTLIAGICSLGIIGVKREDRPFKLWVPEDSDFTKILDWKTKNFPDSYKFHLNLFKADNILTRDVLLEMLYIHDVMVNISASVNDVIPGENLTEGSDSRLVKWRDICVRIPVLPTSSFRKKRSNWIVDDNTPEIYANSISSRLISDTTKQEREIFQSSRVKRQTGFEWLSYLPSDMYCDIIEMTKYACYERSILEIWGYDRNVIEILTDEQIIEDINSVETSGVFGRRTNFSSMLANTERDSSGKIIKAGASFELKISNVNFDRIIPGKFVDLYLGGEEVDVDTVRWEKQAVGELLQASDELNHSQYKFMLSQSFNEVAEGAIYDDSKLIPIGYGVVFIYILLILGRFNIVEARPVLSISGLISVGMSLVISFGICLTLGFQDTLVNTVLPFLLLALGIDDMFVIMQSLNNLSEEERNCDLPTRIGHTLKNAGSSILVTSITDMAAFAIGSLTIIPALKSFCIYASVGIVTVFILQVTFFVACLKFDEQRIEDKRNSIICCFKMKKWNSTGHKGYAQSFFSKIYPKIFLNPVMKIMVLFVTFGFFGISCFGASNLEQKFDIYWFISNRTYLRDFIENYYENFPDKAEYGQIFISNISLHKELHNIEYIVDQLQSSEYIGRVDAWYTNYKIYFERQGYEVPDPDITEEQFQYDLSTFLFSPEGSMFHRNFIFESPLQCGEPAPKVISLKLEYQYKKYKTTKEKLAVLDFVKSISRTSNMSFVAPYSYIHAAWENDAVIENELLTNLLLAIVVIFLIILLLLSSLTQSLLVLSCVFFTLVEVGALMHWWGLTIDGAATINLILAVGLCVDYSTHIGELFNCSN